jgi:hypothetical protein
VFLYNGINIHWSALLISKELTLFFDRFVLKLEAGSKKISKYPWKNSALLQGAKNCYIRISICTLERKDIGSLECHTLNQDCKQCMQKYYFHVQDGDFSNKYIKNLGAVHSYSTICVCFYILMNYIYYFLWSLYIVVRKKYPIWRDPQYW